MDPKVVSKLRKATGFSKLTAEMQEKERRWKERAREQEEKERERAREQEEKERSSREKKKRAREDKELLEYWKQRVVTPKIAELVKSKRAREHEAEQKRIRWEKRRTSSRLEEQEKQKEWTLRAKWIIRDIDPDWKKEIGDLLTLGWIPTSDFIRYVIDTYKYFKVWGFHEEEGEAIDGGEDAMEVRRFYAELRDESLKNLEEIVQFILPHIQQLDYRVLRSAHQKEAGPIADILNSEIENRRNVFDKRLLNILSSLKKAYPEKVSYNLRRRITFETAYSELCDDLREGQVPQVELIRLVEILRHYNLLNMYDLELHTIGRKELCEIVRLALVGRVEGGE